MMTARKRKPKTRKPKARTKSQSKKEVRQRFNFLVVGINGTGKSVFVQKAAKELQAERILVVTLSGSPTIWEKYKEIDLNDKAEVAKFKGIRTVKALRYDKKTLQIIHSNFRNGLVIFDDCKPYIKPNLDHTKGLVELLADFRHYGIDMCFVLHSVGQVPPEVWSHCRYVYIGKTNRMIPKNFPLDKVDELIEVQNIVNQKFDEASKKGGTAKYGLFKQVKL